MSTAIKHPVPDRVKLSFVIFDIRALDTDNSGRYYLSCSKYVVSYRTVVDQDQWPLSTVLYVKWLSWCVRVMKVWTSENVPVGTVIVRLRARDRDVGRNARIVYEFSQHTVDQYGHLFGIKADTGKIYIKNNLDFEV